MTNNAARHTAAHAGSLPGLAPAMVRSCRARMPWANLRASSHHRR